MCQMRFTLVWFCGAVAVAANSAAAGNAAKAGKVVEESPTLKCLGVRWFVAGDDNQNAQVLVGYRKVGEAKWRRGLNLFRVDSSGMRKAVRPPAGETLFAGSVFDLEEDTEYEVKLVLSDPDGVGAERILQMKTWAEPKMPPGGRTVDVRPGGLAAALGQSKPDDTLRLAPGVYRGTFAPKSGTSERPIAIVGSPGGKTILDGQGSSNVISASGLHDVFFENLALQNAKYGIAVNEGARITVRRCTIRDVDYGFVAQRNGDRQQRIYIADNVMTGRSRWPRTEGIESRRGVQIAGTGHVVCYNRISNFADAIDTFSVYPCAAIDFYGNDISECTDDGIEMDYSEHNTRCFDNRLTNVFQAISAQPAQGGPVYIFRNAMYNVGHATFKLHNNTSGVLLFHNTSVRTGMPLVLSTHETVTNCVSRNNLFIGTAGNYAYETTAKMRDCDFNYDGFGGQWTKFLKWNKVRYDSIEAVRQKAPVYRHVIRVDPRGLFQSGVQAPGDIKTQFPPKTNDLRLSHRNRAIDAGVVLPNINDNFAGKAPDLGAYELGSPMPHYGPRE